MDSTSYGESLTEMPVRILQSRTAGWLMSYPLWRQKTTSTGDQLLRAPQQIGAVMVLGSALVSGNKPFVHDGYFIPQLIALSLHPIQLAHPRVQLALGFVQLLFQLFTFLMHTRCCFSLHEPRLW